MRVTDASLTERWMLVGWLTIFLVGTDLFVVAPFLPVISQEVGVSVTSLTWMVSAFSLTYAISCPLQGSLAERVGLPRVLIGGLALLAIGNLWTSVSSELIQLVLSRIVAGLGAAATSPMLYALAAELAGPERRGSALATIGSGLLIALVMGSPIGLVIGTWSDWRDVFLALSFAFTVMIPINLFTWRKVVRNPKPDRENRSIVIASEPLRASVPFLLAMLFWSTSVYAIYTLLGTALVMEYRLSVVESAEVLAAYGLGAAAGSILGGKLADRLGPERLTILSLVAMLGTCSFAFWAFHLGLPFILAIALFAFSISAYGFFPALQACAAKRFSGRRPTVLGLISSSLYAGLTLGAMEAGRLYPSIGMTGVIASSIIPIFLTILMVRRVNTQLNNYTKS